MATWKTYSVKEVMDFIIGNSFVLPVIQRRLVWEEEKMELLFDTLLKGDSFGGIMALKEDSNTKPLFASRSFSKDGKDVDSVLIEKLNKERFLIIDGQQRLQSFYLGLYGSYNGKVLYFNLLGDYANLEYEFKFSETSDRLPKSIKDINENPKRTLWYPAFDLYFKMAETYDDRQISEEIIQQYEITDNNEKTAVEKNTYAFYNNVFTAPSIGVSLVHINKTMSEQFNRQRIVEEFRRLNDGGTKLSSYDLVASILKGFNWEMERFLDEVTNRYKDLNIDQDFIIKLMFLLQDDSKKDMASLTAEEANFAVKNKERILICFELLKKYLTMAKLENYYNNANRSEIPLYFIIYHFFHKKIDNAYLPKIYNDYDVHNEDYRKITQWMYVSLLNGVFSRGRGWIPYITGIRKILLVMKMNKGKIFPTNEIFKVYHSHPLHDFAGVIISSGMLNRYDEDFVYYLMYNCEKQVRRDDKDHIHPQSKLLDKYEINKINRITNKQLLDADINRHEKNNKDLKIWIDNYVTNKTLYMERHLIPVEEKLIDGSSSWNIDNYEKFLNTRAELIAIKIHNILGMYN